MNVCKAIVYLIIAQVKNKAITSFTRKHSSKATDRSRRIRSAPNIRTALTLGINLGSGGHPNRYGPGSLLFLLSNPLLQNPATFFDWLWVVG